MQSPITVVIPIYNRADTLGRTLGSIERQTIPPARVILVDNNSTDSSPNIISDWAKGHGNITVISEPTPGACPARNRGLREVDTEWTIFFDSDDEMLPSHIEDFTRAISRYPQADIIGRDVLFRFIDGTTGRGYFHSGSNAMFHHLFRGCLATQRYAGRTTLFRNCGGWNERLDGWNDLELGVRLLLASPQITQLHGSPSVITYQQQVSITGIDFSSHPERWEDSLNAIRSLFLRLPDSCKLKHRYLTWLDARAIVLAAQYEREALKSAASGDTLRSKISQDLAHSLYDKVMTRTSCPKRISMIYRHNLTFNRLTWLLARIIL